MKLRTLAVVLMLSISAFGQKPRAGIPVNGTTPSPLGGTVAGKPATCAIGEEYTAYDATPSSCTKYICTAANTWTQQCGSAGAGNTNSTSLTSGKYPKANGANSIVDGCISDDGTTVTNACTGGEQTSGAAAGFYGLGQGTAQGVVANTIGLTAPTSVTGYNLVYPGAAASGVLAWVNVSNVVTATFKPIQGTDSNLLSSGTISGVAAPLCTDSNGGATTTGCPSGSGGGISSPTFILLPYFIPSSNDEGALAANSANAIEVGLVPIAFTKSVTSIGVDLTTASSGQTCDAGLYDSAGNLLFHFSSGFSATSTGQKTATVSYSLTPGMYFEAFTCTDTVATVRSAGPDTNSILLMNAGTAVFGRSATSATSGVLPATISLTLTADFKQLPVMVLK